MEAAGGSGGSTINNSKVLRNAYNLFDILHDDIIPAKDKLPLMKKVLSGVDVDINVPNEHDGRNTLLHGAVVHGFIYVVKLLLQYKANVDSRNTEGETPLHLVLSDKRINKSKVQKPIIQILLGHKADVNIKNLAGVTPRDLVKEKNNKILNDLFDPSFNKPDPAPEDEIHPDQGNNAGVADTSVEKDANQVEQAEDAFAGFKDTYIASGAKHSFHGTVYQLCLLMMFALRAFRLGYPFRLGTEADEGEQFDDIVLYQRPQGGKRTTLFVQAKHKENAGKGLNLNDLLAKGKKAAFSLLKYFKSFVKIMQAEGQKAIEIDFVICTNTHFNFKHDEPGKLNCVNVDNKAHLEELGKNVTLLAKEQSFKKFFAEGKCFKLDRPTDDKTVELLKDYFVAEYKAELSLLTDSISKTKELNDILSSLNDTTALSTFLNNLTFVVEQPADNELVKTEFSSQSKTKLLDTDILTDAFYKHLHDWFSNKEGVWLKNETVEKIIGSITGTINTYASSWISRVYAERLLTSPHKFNEGKLDELNDLMREYRFVNLAASTETKLTLIQVAQAIEYSGYFVKFDSYMFMHISSLLTHGNQDLIIGAFKSPDNHDLLVIDCLSKTEQVSQRELTTLGNKLLEITTNNPQKKLVIIAPEKHVFAEMFSQCSGYYKHTVTNIWKDFTNETQDILLATQVDFQGQLLELNQVIDKTETELLEIVPLETLIGDEGLVIGTELPTSVGYNECFYIDRSVNYVNQIVLKAEMVEDKTKKELKEGFTKTESDFKNLCQVNSRENIHLIEKQGDRYIWVKSQGEFKSLRHYIDYTNYQTYSEEVFLNSVKLQRVVIISDLAGMGKSTVLTHFSNKIKTKNNGTLVFRIDLNSHTKLLENHKSTLFDNTSAIEFFCEEIIMMKTSLEKALFERKDKVVLLFDGFDEISPDYEETVFGLIQSLIEATEAQIWITTRPFMKEKLEDKLRQWSSSLEPFSQQNQVDYLTKYWKHMKNFKDSEECRIKDFASSLISQFSKSISDKEREFAGIPLQMKMLAECFVDDFEKSLDLKKCFNLVDLYKKFIDKKFDIYHIEKSETDGSKVGTKHIQNLFFDSCIIQHRYLALSVILSENMFAFLLPNYKNVIDSDEKINMINKIGIVNLSNGTPHFIHRTFAEFCFAEYFMELLKDTKCLSPSLKSFVLSELLIRNNYAVFRSFLNGLLAKCQPATGTLSKFQNPLITRDDMNNRYTEIQVIFVRTAIEGNNNICVHLLNGFEGKYEEMLKVLQGNEPDERMLNLAAANNNFKFIESLLRWTLDNTGQDQKTVKRMLKACDSNGKTSLHSASAAGHNDVVQILLQWTHDNVEQSQDKVKRMLLACDSRGWTSLHRASDSGRNDVVHTLLQWTRYNLEQGQEVVTQMLEACNSDGQTSLHKASEAGHSYVVQTLLQWTRDNLDGGQATVKRMLEACDSRDWISLHCASEAGHSGAVQTLLQWTLDNLNGGQDLVKRMLEACNRTGWTSLHWASMSGRNDVVQILLKWTRDNLGGGQEIMKRMLEACDSKGWTSLHRASMSGHFDVVQTLLQWTQDNLEGGQEIVKWMLMTSDSNGNTSLRLASVLGHSDVVVTLLKWIKTLDNGIQRVRLVLLSVDESGRTVLGQLSNYDVREIPHRLLQWTLDNIGEETLRELLLKPDCEGRTALELSQDQSHRYDCEKIIEWAMGNSKVNLREHISALKNTDESIVYTC